MNEPEGQRIAILRVVAITIPPPWQWRAEDVNAPYASGGLLRCYEPGGAREFGYLLGLDVTADPDEPTIDDFGAEEAGRLDQMALENTRNAMAASGRALKAWSASQFKQAGARKALVSQYSAQDGGRERRHIDIRFTHDGRKLLVGGCYDADQGEQLAGAIARALEGASPL